MVPFATNGPVLSLEGDQPSVSYKLGLGLGHSMLLEIAARGLHEGMLCLERLKVEIIEHSGPETDPTVLVFVSGYSQGRLRTGKGG